MLARKYQQEQKKYDDFQPRPRRQREPQRQTLTQRRVMLNTALRRQCFVLLLVASVLAMIITARSSIIATRGYELGTIQAQAMKLETENAQIQIDIAKLKAPQRIKDLATRDFGMSVPQQVYFASEAGGE